MVEISKELACSDSSVMQSKNTASKYPAERKKGLIPFQPGESGNPKGRPPNVRYLSEALNELLRANPQEAKTIILAAIESAKKGNVEALRELWNRAEGKVLDTHKFEGDVPVNIIFKPIEREDV